MTHEGTFSVEFGGYRITFKLPKGISEIELLARLAQGKLEQIGPIERRGWIPIEDENRRRV